MSNLFSKAKTDMHFLFVKKSKLTAKERRRKRRAISLICGIVLILLQIVSMVLFLLEILKLDMLPMNYLIVLNVVLAVILLYNMISQFTTANIIGKLLSVVLSAAMLFGFFFASKMNTTLGQVTDTTTRIDKVNVVVLNSNDAAAITDTTGYTYGYNANVSADTITKALEDIPAEYSVEINSKEYTNWEDLLEDLYAEDAIQALAITDSLYTSITEEFEDFQTKTKIIGTVEITSEVKLSTSEKQVNEEPFIIYLCGNDETGTISSTGRTDVNILAVCNPVTKQILLVSTPRDSYITIANSSGQTGLDKLTHASNNGIEYSIDALSRLYGVTADYYVRINFTGCINIVDALGGITINSDVEFENGWEAWYNTYHYYVGANECDGEKTLAFVRERKAFLDGDFQRGKNQEAALAGIIDKVTSPAILTNYSAFFESVSDMILTNMPTSTISALVKGQLSDSTPWNVQSYSLEGTTSTRDGQIYNLKGMSVVLPYGDSINLAIELMSKTMNGDVFDVDEYVEARNNTETEE